VDFLFAAAFFLFGLAFGSFLNVCIHRMPRRINAREDREELEERMRREPELAGPLSAEIARLQAAERGLSVAEGRSACPACGAKITAWDNIPVLSWLLLGGRCRHCKAPISPRYWIVELFTALLFLACYLKFGLTFSAAKYCVLSFLLLGLIFTDAEWKLLPDALTLPGLGLGVFFSLFVPVNDLTTRIVSALFSPALLPMASGMPGGHGEMGWRLMSLAQSALSAAVGASFIYGAGMIYLRARGVEGMGMGDVKLMAMVGAFLGVTLTVMTLFLASLLGSLFGLTTILIVWLRRTRRRMRRGREPAALARRRAWRSAQIMYRFYEMPFGVFLGVVALAAAFFGNVIVGWYWEHFR